jgi:hypothetical protein
MPLAPKIATLLIVFLVFGRRVDREAIQTRVVDAYRAVTTEGDIHWRLGSDAKRVLAMAPS